MIIKFHKVNLKKKFPLQISRGIHSESQNVFIELIEDGITAWGESAPGKAEGASSAIQVEESLVKLIEEGIEGLSIYDVYQKGKELKTPPCALAALDIALWDLKAKKANLQLNDLLGIPKPSTPTSITVGINPPEVVKKRVELILKNKQVRALKIKLGSPNGIDYDKEIYSQVLESTKSSKISIRVDANGGWALDDAKEMIKWLSERNAEYIEQPLAEGNEDQLKFLFKGRSLPIFVDESCRFSEDVPRLANFVDGVNLKLMKCGGITEALRILNTARSFGLKTMIGCMSESSVSISAGASLTGIIDYVDLDSHYNLSPDPSSGAVMINGVTMTNNGDGHGANLNIENYV
jgi:muconate cycloisomerase|tara:strand:+ start:16212 stop:17261 length:1050 start_codon:yes stop_codon:yes gene_type:complete